MVPEITPDIKNAFELWKPENRATGHQLRDLIFKAAEQLPEVGEITETLKWGQPSYLTEQTRSGSTIRLGELNQGSKIGLFVHCQTSLVDMFKQHYPDQLQYEKKRAIVIDPEEELDQEAIEHCIGLALTYHKIKSRHVA